MAISTSRVFGALALIIASGFVLTPITSTSAAGTEDACYAYNTSCKNCLDLTLHPTVTNCTYYYSSSDFRCSATPVAFPEVKSTNNITECKDEPTPQTTTTVAPPPTTTNATTTTTPATPTTNGTTTVPTTTAAPPTTNGTTVPPTTPTTTPTPSNSTTTSTPPPTTAAPSHGGGGMSWTSFFGGIVFTAAISAVAYLVWRFYRARQERNYHTLTTNLI